MVRRGDLVVIGVCSGLALGILVAALIFCAIRWYKKHANLRRCANERSDTALPIRTNGFATSTEFSASITSTVDIPVSEHAPKNSHHSWWNRHTKDQFTSVSGIPKYHYKCSGDSQLVFGSRDDMLHLYWDIQKATQDFTTLLGQGSFGPVYKASLSTGGIAAVKVLASNSSQGEKEFQTEVSVLGRLHHRNLVNLVGYCVDKGSRMLVYELMSNGSLENLLYGEGKRRLSWDDRLEIALDISHGIEYLHDGAVPPIIHRDLKSANILLDQNMRAKVADFGLSKEQVYDGQKSSLKGTYGYIDPEYLSTNKYTMKSDIFSFGVIIFELITAIHPQQNLMEYANLAAMSPDGVDEIIDQRLVGKCNVVEVRALARIGHKCLHKLARRRPSIREVTEAILKIKQRRLAKEDTTSFSENDVSLSRAVSRMEAQHVQLSKLGGIEETNE